MNKISLLVFALLCAITAKVEAREIAKQQPSKTLSFCPEPQLLYKQESDFPFTYFWRRDYIDIRKFDKIFIKPPVNQWLDKVNQKKAGGEQLKIWESEIATLNEKFLAAFASQIRSVGRFIELRQTDKPDDKTMILEVAFIPLMSLDSFYRYLDYSKTTNLTVKSLPHGLISAGFLSIEAVVRDSRGKLVAQLGSILPGAKKFDVNAEKTWVTHADVAIKNWNKDFIATIKAELNRSKEGIYISISGKPAKKKNDN